MMHNAKAVYDHLASWLHHEFNGDKALKKENAEADAATKTIFR